MAKADIEILLVEDNPDHAEFILSALNQDSTMQTHWSKNGEDALEFLWQRDAAQRPLIVLLDIHLPKVDGHDVLRQIRREDGLRSIPVIVLTTSEREEEISAAYRAGANGYITKPMQIGEFTEKIKSLKRYWTFTSRIPRV